MPIVTVTAAPLPEAAERAALVRLTAVVATALDLPSDGVFATTVAARTSVLGATDHQWPLVILYGGARDPEQMDAAATAAENAVRESWDATEVWVQWQVRA